MTKSNANLLTAALVISAPALVGCIPPGGAYFPAAGTTTSGTWTTDQSTADQPSTVAPSSTADQPSTAVQQWHFQPVMLPWLGGRCLDAASTAPGTPVQLGVCDGSERQRWAFTGAGDLRTPDGKCLDAQWGSTADGTPLWIWECNGSPAQQFRFHGSMLLGPVNKCVGISSASTAAWAPAVLYSCVPPPPQPPPPPPPPPQNWSADPHVVSACDLAFSSPAAEQACLGAVARYRYNPRDVIGACDLATSSDEHALRCVRQGGRARVDLSDTIRACDLATSSDVAVNACVATAAWIDGDAPAAVRACDASTNSDDELAACLQRMSGRR
jgi:Ricin-type beta-trefoil lectin domain